MQTRAYTILEVLAVMAVIAILVAVGTHVTAGAREKGRQSSCAANLKAIYTAGVLYGAEYDDAEPIDATIPLSQRFFGHPSLIARRVGKATMYCPDFPSCARRFYGSGYTFPVPPPEQTSEGLPRDNRALRDDIEKYGSDLPVVYCLSHDEAFYTPREADLSDFVNPPFALWLRPDGSVRQGRLSVMRDRVIEHYCKLPDGKKRP